MFVLAAHPGGDRSQSLPQREGLGLPGAGLGARGLRTHVHLHQVPLFRMFPACTTRLAEKLMGVSVSAVILKLKGWQPLRPCVRTCFKL